MKLETLKDIEKDLLIFYGACGHCINNVDYTAINGEDHPLKRGAIKHIKKLLWRLHLKPKDLRIHRKGTSIITCLGETDDCPIAIYPEMQRREFHIISFIVYFFDITEEDLK